MPRRKTQQPNPLSIEFYGDILVEIHDASTWPIYRGSHTVAKWKHKATIMLFAVCEDYFQPDPTRERTDPAGQKATPPPMYLQEPTENLRRFVGVNFWGQWCEVD